MSESTHIRKLSGRSLFVVILLTFNLYGQRDSTDWKLKISDCKASLGYFYQGEHFFEAGLKIDYIDEGTAQNLSLIPGFQVTKHDGSTYLNPFVMLRYFKFVIPQRVAAVVCVSANYRKIGGISAFTITPEAGVSFGTISLTYGFNLFQDNRYPWVSHHRIALRLSLY